MEAHILINYASRSRPQRFKEGINSLLSLISHKEDYTILCVLDKDDPTHQEYVDILAALQRVNYHIVLSRGKSTGKIDAINRRIPDYIPWDILVNFSDDMKMLVYGWDRLIRDGVRINGPDVFLHYPDSTAKNMLPTMTVVDRTYYQRDGFIYHPSYESLWADNEAMDVAQIRRRYFYMGIQIFDHYHPSYGHVPFDEQYLRQQALWVKDEGNYLFRKANHYFLDATQHSYTDAGKAAALI